MFEHTRDTPRDNHRQESKGEEATVEEKIKEKYFFRWELLMLINGDERNKRINAELLDGSVFSHVGVFMRYYPSQSVMHNEH